MAETHDDAIRSAERADLSTLRLKGHRNHAIRCMPVGTEERRPGIGAAFQLGKFRVNRLTERLGASMALFLAT